MVYVVDASENWGDDGRSALTFRCESYRFEAGWAIFEGIGGVTGKVYATQNHWFEINEYIPEEEASPF